MEIFYSTTTIALVILSSACVILFQSLATSLTEKINFYKNSFNSYLDDRNELKSDYKDIQEIRYHYDKIKNNVFDQIPLQATKEIIRLVSILGIAAFSILLTSIHGGIPSFFELTWPTWLDQGVIFSLNLVGAIVFIGILVSSSRKDGFIKDWKSRNQIINEHCRELDKNFRLVSKILKERKIKENEDI